MLYGDYIDLDRAAAKGPTPFRGRFALTRTTQRTAQEVPVVVDGHGTGVSTDRSLPVHSFTHRSFTPRALAQAVLNPGAWTLALSVLGNMIAGSLLLGALLLLPQALGKVLGIL